MISCSRNQNILKIQRYPARVCNFKPLTFGILDSIEGDTFEILSPGLPALFGEYGVFCALKPVPSY